MDLDARPPLDPLELEAVRLALARAGLVLDGPPHAYASAWRSAGRAEGAGDGEPDDEDIAYTRSPRSTLGATRA